MVIFCYLLWLEQIVLTLQKKFLSKSQNVYFQIWTRISNILNRKPSRLQFIFIRFVLFIAYIRLILLVTSLYGTRFLLLVLLGLFLYITLLYILCIYFFKSDGLKFIFDKDNFSLTILSYLIFLYLLIRLMCLFR